MARHVAVRNVGQLPWLGWRAGHQNVTIKVDEVHMGIAVQRIQDLRAVSYCGVPVVLGWEGRRRGCPDAVRTLRHRQVLEKLIGGDADLLRGWIIEPKSNRLVGIDHSG